MEEFIQVTVKQIHELASTNQCDGQNSLVGRQEVLRAEYTKLNNMTIVI